MDPKPWWQSKMLWANIITLLVTIIGLPEVTGLFGPDSLKIIIMLQGVMNVLLRFVTIGSVTNPVADWFKKAK